MYSKGHLRRLATEHYEQLWHERGSPDKVVLKAAPDDFLDRICVNYLRHNELPYDRWLGEVRGQVGVSDAYLIFRQRVLNAIADAYPWLAQECRRQLGKLGEDELLSQTEPVSGER